MKPAGLPLLVFVWRPEVRRVGQFGDRKRLVRNAAFNVLVFEVNT